MIAAPPSPQVPAYAPGYAAAPPAAPAYVSAAPSSPAYVPPSAPVAYGGAPAQPAYNPGSAETVAPSAGLFAPILTAPVGTMVTCPRCAASTPLGFAFCQQCGFQLPPDPQAATMAAAQDAAIRAAAAARAPAPQPAPIPAPPPLAIAPTAPANAWGMAVAVNRDGTDGDRFVFATDFVVIGRAGADIAFDQDRFLARNHARLERTSDGARVVPLDAFNGVFRKVEDAVELVDGAVMLVGREVLRFERVDIDERVAEPLVRHGVALFGSPPRDPWGRLLQLIPTGGIRDVRH